MEDNKDLSGNSENMMSGNEKENSGWSLEKAEQGVEKTEFVSETASLTEQENAVAVSEGNKETPIASASESAGKVTLEKQDDATDGVAENVRTEELQASQEPIQVSEEMQPSQEPVQIAKELFPSNEPQKDLYQESGSYDPADNMNQINFAWSNPGLNQGYGGYAQGQGGMNAAYGAGQQVSGMNAGYGANQQPSGMNAGYGASQDPNGAPYGNMQYPAEGNIPNDNASNKKNKKQRRPLTPEENKKANILCFISLGCFVLPILLGMVTSNFGLPTIFKNSNYNIEQLRNVSTTLVSVLESIISSSYIGAIVLMIIVRVKYPQNTFGKVLMWVYIALYSIALITMVVFIIACGIACNSAMNSCRDCPGFIMGAEILKNLFMLFT